MGLRKSTKFTWKPRGLSDTIDASNTFAGAMQKLTNLIPDPRVKDFFIPRPAASQLTDFTGFNTPAQIEALFVSGTIAYGMVASARFAGKSEPFAINMLTGAFLTLTGVVTGNCPTTQAATGDWTPPTMDRIGTRIVVTHPGFPGGTVKFGWFDISSFSSASITGDTHTNTTLDNLSTNVLAAGWEPGMAISLSNGDIPAGTTIVSIAVGGLSVVLSAAATGTHAGGTATVTGGTAASPKWAAGDTNGNNLSSTPVAVAQYNGRAWFAVKNGVVFSDALNATQVTNATQALTFGNGLNVTALAGLPLQSSTAGGMIQSLIAFQGDANMVQITGDQATTDLKTNNLGVGVGTLAPNTIAPCTLGLIFVSSDGVRIIDFLANVSDPIGANGAGVSLPFINAINPTRMAAAFNDNVYRVSVKNGSDPNQATQDYWLDFGQKIWSGPHDFPAALIEADQDSDGGFVMVATGVDAKLFDSKVIPTVNDTYTENGNAMSFEWLTALLPDNDTMSMNAVVETMLGMALPANGTVGIAVYDEFGTVLDQLILNNVQPDGDKWDVGKWDAAKWAGGTSLYRQHPLFWNNQLVFKQAVFQTNGACLLGFSIGALRINLQKRDYLTQLAS